MPNRALPVPPNAILGRAASTLSVAPPTRPRTRACALTALLLLCLSALLATAPTASAAAPPARPTLGKDHRWHLPLAHIGYRDVQLKGQIATSEVFVPVPRGLQPLMMTATVTVSPDVGGGYLEVRQADDTLATFVIDRRKHLRGEAITIPLVDTTVTRDMLALTFYARIRTADNACESAVIGTRVTLERSVVTFGGAADAPTSIGDFLPPVLDHLSIWIPPAPTEAEAGAALRIATAAVARYAGQNARVALYGGTRLPAAQDTPFSRVIVVRRNGSAGARLIRSGRGPVLTFSGPADVLDRTSRTFAGGMSPLAIGTELQALMIDEDAPFTGDRYTFEALGFRQLQATGVGRIEIPMAFSQYGLGGSVRGLTFRLSGAHTPVASGAHATLGVLVNGVLVRAVELTHTGRFDATLEIPSHLIQRDNSAAIRVDYAPDDGVCILGIHPFTIQISPRSTIDVSRGEGVNEGFLRYPQALGGGFDVAFDRLTLTHTRIALDLLTSLQKLAGSPLQPTVTSWRRAREGKRTAVLITSDPAKARGLDPPLDPDPFRVVDAGGRVVLSAKSDAPFAVLEAFRARNRDILLLAAKRGLPLMQDLAAGLREEGGGSGGGWFGLTGDVLVQPELGSPVNMNLRSRSLRAEPLEPVRSSGSALLRSASFPAAVVSALILLAFIYPRLVRRAPEAPEP